MDLHTDPTVHDFQGLREKIRQEKDIDSHDVQLIQFGMEMLSKGVMVGSEMVNTVNSVWTALLDKKNRFWEAIGMLSSSSHIATKSMAMSLMARRIADEGQTLEDYIKEQIGRFLHQSQEQVTSDKHLFKSELRTTVCEALVMLFKVDLKVLFVNYIEAASLELGSFTQEKVIFMVDVFRRVIREGYDSWYEESTIQQTQQIKGCVEGVLRNILQIVCYCLEGKYADVVENCLTFLVETIAFFPAFEIFNSHLLDNLMKLMESKEHHYTSLMCMKEIFSFKEEENIKQHHLKISKKLLEVLDKLMHRVGIQQRRDNINRPVHFYENQSQSTNDSIYSKSTHKSNGAKKKKENYMYELIELLNLYLGRYVPFMESREQNLGYEIQCDSSLKIHFDQDLYEHLGHVYWNFTEFLLKFGQEVPSNLLHKNSSQLLVEEYFINSIKFLLQLKIKLNLSQERTGELIQLLILKATPLPKGFKKFYIYADILTENGRSCFPEQIRQPQEEQNNLYRSTIRTILSDRKLCSIYKEVLQKLLKTIQEVQPKTSEEVCQSVNIINRISWCLVCTFRYFPFDPKEFPITKITGGFLSIYGKREEKIKKCFGINIKYLQLIDKLGFSTIILTDQEILQEEIWQLHCIIFSQVVLDEEFSIVDWNLEKEVFGNSFFNYLVGWVKAVTVINTFDQEFQKVYPAMIKLAGHIRKYFRDVVQQKQNGRKITEKAFGIVKQAIYTPFSEAVKKLFEENTTVHLMIPSIKIVNQYLGFLELISNFLIDEGYRGKNSEERKLYGGSMFHNKKIMAELEFLEQIYLKLSNNISNEETQNFQVQQILEFRQKYHFMLQNLLKLHIILDKNRAPEKQNKNPEKDAITIFQHPISTLYNDFKQQLNFKCLKYFDLVLQWFDVFAKTRVGNYKQHINEVIQQLHTTLRGSNVSQVQIYVIKELEFWRKVVLTFAFDLSEENLSTLKQFFRNLEENFSASYIELSCEVVQAIFHKIQHYNNQGRPRIWEDAISYAIDTFQKSINLTINNQQVFKKLSHMLYYQIYTISRNNLSLEVHGYSKDNRELLYLMFRNHVYTNVEKVRNQYNEAHDQLLKNLFKECQEKDFVIFLKNYKVALLKWVKQGQKELFSA